MQREKINNEELNNNEGKQGQKHATIQLAASGHYIPPFKRGQKGKKTVSDKNFDSSMPNLTHHAKLRKKQDEISLASMQDALQAGEQLKHAESDTYIDETTQVVLAKDRKVITVLDNKRNTQFDLMNKTKVREQRLIKEATTKRNDRAMCELAELYLDGSLGNREVAKAKQWLLKAARNGHGNSHAMCLLSKLYESGDLGAPDPDCAFKWLEKAAERSNKYALAIVGQHYLNKYLSMSKDEAIEGQEKFAAIRKAYNFLERSANKGGTRAMWHIAKIHEEGWLGEKNLSKAIEIYTKAAKLGSPNSINTLNRFCIEEKIKVEDFEVILDVASRLIARTSSDLAIEIGLEQICGNLGKNISRGFDMLEQAARNRNTEAMRLLITLYNNGEYCTPNLERKQYWLEQLQAFYQAAAEQGNIEAMMSLGYLFLNAAFRKIDFEAAEKHFLQAAATRDIECMYEVGTLYLEGCLGNKDPSQGRFWLNKAIVKGKELALGGNIRAAVLVANIYCDKELGFKDYQKASQWLLFAANKGHMEAKLDFAKLHVKKSFTIQNALEAATFLKKDKRIPMRFRSRAMRILGDLYSKGNDSQRACYWYNRAARQGNSKAMYRLGKHFEVNSEKKENLITALKYYKASARRGNRKALQCLTLFCHSNNSDIPADFKTSVEPILEKYRLSIEHNDKALLYYQRGRQYQEAIPIDSIQALFWYRKAIKHNHVESSFALARMYESGELGDKVRPIAINFYKRAAKQNHAESIKALIRIYEEGSLMQPDPDKVSKLKLKYTV